MSSLGKLSYLLSRCNNCLPGTIKEVKSWSRPLQSADHLVPRLLSDSCVSRVLFAMEAAPNRGVGQMDLFEREMGLRGGHWKSVRSSQ